jgi:predicted transposase/invertase (TIGR01784 family)
LSHHQILDIETHERNLKDFSFSFLELAKFKKSKKELITITEKWAYFFKNAEKTDEKDLDAIIGDDLIIKRAYEELNKYSWTKEELRLYDSIDMKQAADKAINEKAFEDGIEKGKAEGKEEGKIEGAIAEKHNIARAMKKKGISVDIIAETTGLPQKEIKSL